MAETNKSTIGGIPYDDLCRGLRKYYSFNLVDLMDTSQNPKPLPFKTAVRTLVKQIDDTFTDILLQQHDKIIEAFTIGKTHARRVSTKKGPYGRSFHPFVRNDPLTWKFDNGINGRWRDYNKNQKYDGLIALTAVTGDVIPDEVKAAHGFMDVEQYSIALEQSLIQYYMLECPDSRLSNESFNPGNLCKGGKPHAGIVYVAFKLKDFDEQLFDDIDDLSTEHDVARSTCRELNDLKSDDLSNPDVPVPNIRLGESSSKLSSRHFATFSTQRPVNCDAEESFGNLTNEKSHTTSVSTREMSNRSIHMKKVATQSTFQHEEHRQETHTHKGRKSTESMKRVSFEVPNSNSDKTPEISQKARVAGSSEQRIIPRKQRKAIDAIPQISQDTHITSPTAENIFPRRQRKDIDETPEVSQETRVTNSSERRISPRTLQKTVQETPNVSQETRVADSSGRRRQGKTKTQVSQVARVTRLKCQDDSNSVPKDNIDAPLSKRKRLSSQDRKQESELNDKDFSNRTGLDQTQNKSKFNDKRQMSHDEGGVNVPVSGITGQNNQQPCEFPCTFCGKRFSCRKNLERHENIHTRKKLYKCTYCRREFTDSSNWIKHERRHLEKKANCDSIKRKNTNVIAVEESMQETLDSTSRSACVPSAQHKKGHLAMKVTSDNKLVKSLEKTRSVSQNSSDVKMTKTASVSRKSEKSNSYDRPHDVQTVRNTTEQEEAQTGVSQPPSCTTLVQQSNACNGRERRRNERNKEQRQSHQCSVCGKVFSRKGNLKTHKNNVHASFKKFICKNRGKRFTASVYCKKHEKRHEKKARHYDGSTNTVRDCTVKKSVQPFLVQQSCASTSSGSVRSLHVSSSQQCTDMSVDEYKHNSPAEKLVSISPATPKISSRVPSTDLKLKAASKTARRKKTNNCSLRKSKDKSREYQNSTELIQVLETTVSNSSNIASSTVRQPASTEQEMAQAGISQTQRSSMQGINESKNSDKRSTQQNNQQGRSIECPVCGKSVSKSNFKRHENTHTRAKLYTCKYCEKMFTSSDKCRRHEKVHKKNVKQVDSPTAIKSNNVQLVQQRCASTSSGLVRSLHVSSSQQCTDIPTDMSVDEYRHNSPELVSKSHASTKSSSRVPSTHLKLKAASKTARGKKTDNCSLGKSEDKSREYQNSTELIQVLETTVSNSSNSASSTVRQPASTEQEMTQADISQTQRSSMQGINESRIADKRSYQQNNQQGQSIECSFCGKSVSKSNLKRHENTHTRAKLYTCKFCEKTFTSSDKCKRHEKVHKKNVKQGGSPAAIKTSNVVEELVQQHNVGPTNESIRSPCLFPRKLSQFKHGEHKQDTRTTDKRLKITSPITTEKRDSNSSNNTEKHNNPRKFAKQPTIEHFFGKKIKPSELPINKTSLCEKLQNGIINSGTYEKRSRVEKLKTSERAHENGKTNSRNVSHSPKHPSDEKLTHQMRHNANSSSNEHTPRDYATVSSDQEIGDKQISELKNVLMSKRNSLILKTERSENAISNVQESNFSSANPNAALIETVPIPPRTRDMKNKIVRFPTNDSPPNQKFSKSQCGKTAAKQIDHEAITRAAESVEKHSETTIGNNQFQDGLTCSYCSKTFSEKYRLRRHINIHTKEIKYPCRFCDKQFIHDSSRKRHENSHTPIGTKIYMCRFCDRQFTDSASCKRHETLHNIIDPLSRVYDHSH